MAAVAIVVAVGAGLYAATRTTNVPGQRLGDVAVQTSKEGEPIRMIWGVSRPFAGTLCACQEPPRIERRKQKSGGKGGGGSSTTVEVPRRTYAVLICQGPITGIRRVWRNNKLVYDGRPGSEWGARNNGTFLQRFRFYLGGWSQMPDPNLESIFGVGEVPAMRGMAYMVARDEDLQDTGGAVPQWRFEVERAEGYFLTSRPYAVEAVEASGVTSLGLKESPFVEYREASEVKEVAAVGGTHRSPLVVYGNYSPEPSEVKTVALTGGVFDAPPDPLVVYGNYPPEPSEVKTVALTGGALRRALIVYENYLPESSEVKAIALTGGIFDAP